MSAVQLTEWINQCQESEGYWYVKRLSGNDTQATGSHQAGPYISNVDAFQIFPELHVPAQENPRAGFQIVSVSHDHTAHANIIWYNNRLRDGTRNETRITGLGGIESPLLDTENTGAIALLFFTGQNDGRECRYWVCQDAPEEDAAETFAGPVEPGKPFFWATLGTNLPDVEDDFAQGECWLTAELVTAEWAGRFPTPQEVFDKAISLRDYKQMRIDTRLIQRRDCEYAVFRSVEYADLTQTLRNGINSPSDFLVKANSILQRRKSRSGGSLERHMKAIFDEESIKYQPQAHTENRNRPDFVFPSQAAYDNSSYPNERLRMLAVKTTVKERWRQILEEANRIPHKHLLTLQEGVSEQQFAQMSDAGIQLVVPESLHDKYPQSVRTKLMTLRDLVEEVRGI